MADPSSADPSSTEDPKTPSCTVCQRRKVRCDRQVPCSACVKHKAECIYREPWLFRRRKRQHPEDAPMYGELNYALSRQIGRPQPPSLATMYTGSPGITHPESGMMIAGGGRSVYVEGNPWPSIQTQLPPAEEVPWEGSNYGDSGRSPQEHDEDESSLIFGAKTGKSVTALHPPTRHIFKLWQTFLENVHPLVKVLHGPTTQQQILEATGDLSSISKGLEALMFSIYCIALVSMDADEAQQTFGERKTALLSKYRRGARLALLNTGILRTSDVVVLQAFVLFLLAMRAFSDAQSIWSLCGVAVRMAQRIGLHRDGKQHALSVFDTEMHRRLWLQLSILDATTAQNAGIGSQMSPMAADIPRPANVNDCDLDPRMTESPREHEGATEMIFCLARSEFGAWLRRWCKYAGTSLGTRGFLTSSSLSLAEKDRAIDQLSYTFDTRYLPYCDTSIPLHHMTAMLIRTVIDLLRFTAHHPRHYSGHVAQKEKDYIFSTCLRIAENCDNVQMGVITQRYMWHAENHAPWEVLIYMLYELCHRVDGEETSKAWGLIDRICSRHYRDMQNRPRTAYYTAVHSLILKAWKAHAAERVCCKKPSLPCPDIVSTISEAREKHGAHPVTAYSEARAPVEATGNYDIPLHGPGSFEFNLDHIDLGPMDWGQWDHLLEEFEQDSMNEAFLDANG
ncbi:fungal-specific transcription factor domain protein [Aspergillus sclerotiicarbonarius CBS 121057]|uniref:Fungal-specific transcription factor domain protein n=1 Tax=Aspergillus sclerotiicarbonarius (strain CBS 121057 / IBT 28362) TaxID=1448318 RepID=A0A319DWV8_ASPSB|nr:fungal-specific transcription factor domain protein [Aspergillus sclerotiicarbonarius CBS 121057]